MADNNWQKVKQLFSGAIELAPAERDAFLESECDGDAALLADVKSLLDEHDKTSGDFERNAVDMSRVVAREKHAGRKFGHFSIVREIGAGGMGSVFLAERTDGEFEQSVALKLIRSAVFDAETERRFRRERQILAHLDHPNIAKLLDGGVTPEGEPYLAMEFIDGEPLIDYASRHNLSLKDRLQLFLGVCSAVRYAHQNLTVHRDIKPGNILVTENGVPKLLDFGLAKMLAGDLLDSEQTATAMRAFTPAYASPEQILGNPITTASDVYSLGVVLFELTTGEKPFNFEGKSIEEIIRTVSDSEPPAPSSFDVAKGRQSANIRDRIDADLDNIVLKALQKEPERRYRSVDELIEDIERYLSGRPVLARPSTFRYRASKFVARNKYAVAAACIVAVTLIGAAAVTLWQLSETRRERDRAERRFSDVHKLSNSLLFEIAPKIQRLEGSIEARELLVSRALEYLDSLASEAADDRDLQFELASAYTEIGKLQGNTDEPNLNDFGGAIKSFEKSIALLNGLGDSVETLALKAATLRQQAKARYAQFQIDASIADLDSASALYDNIPDSSIDKLETKVETAKLHAANSAFKKSIATLEPLIADVAAVSSSNPREMRLLANFHAYYGYALSWDSKQADAERVMAKAVEFAEQAVEKFPDDTTSRHTLWDVYLRASAIYETIKDDVSLAFAEKAKRHAEIAVANDKLDAQARNGLARAYFRIGIANGRLKRTGEAIKSFEQQAEIIDYLIAREPKNLGYKGDLSTMLFSLGTTRKLAGDYEGAIEEFKRAIAIHEEIARLDANTTKSERHIGMAAINIGEIFEKMKDRENAKLWFEKAVGHLAPLKEKRALAKYDEAILDKLTVKLAAL